MMDRWFNDAKLFKLFIGVCENFLFGFLICFECFFTLNSENALVTPLRMSKKMI